MNRAQRRADKRFQRHLVKRLKRPADPRLKPGARVEVGSMGTHGVVEKILNDPETGMTVALVRGDNDRLIKAAPAELVYRGAAQ